MKTTILFALVAAFGLASGGCSASGRISVDRNSATKQSNDPRVAFIAKPAPEPR